MMFCRSSFLSALTSLLTSSLIASSCVAQSAGAALASSFCCFCCCPVILIRGEPRYLVLSNQSTLGDPITHRIIDGVDCSHSSLWHPRDQNLVEPLSKRESGGFATVLGNMTVTTVGRGEPV